VENAKINHTWFFILAVALQDSRMKDTMSKRNCCGSFEGKRSRAFQHGVTKMYMNDLLVFPSIVNYVRDSYEPRAGT
jgi:hypothetical protein